MAKSAPAVSTGYRVRQIKGSPANVGRVGTVEKVGGTMAGDTLVQVRLDGGETFECYTRQVEVIGSNR